MIKKTKRSGSNELARKAASKNPIAMLKLDHKKTKGLFAAFEKTNDQDKKNQIVEEAMAELNVHTALEEEIFYPSLRQLLSKKEDLAMMDEALEEHHVAHVLIKELESMGPEGNRYNAKFTVLAENVKHHIKEEEAEMFSKAKKTAANSDSISRKMTERKETLKKTYSLA